MLTVGIAGQIASGKSAVAEVFARHGAVIVSGDDIGRQILDTPLIRRKVIEKLSTQILKPDGSIDRRKLAQLVFGSPDIKRAFDEIVQPALLRKLRAEVRRLKNLSRVRMIVVDAALIFDWGLESELDCLIVVDSRRETQIKRLIAKGLTRQEAGNRIRAQLDKKYQRKNADFIIKNDGTLKQLRLRAERAYENLLAREPVKSR